MSHASEAFEDAMADLPIEALVAQCSRWDGLPVWFGLPWFSVLSPACKVHCAPHYLIGCCRQSLQSRVSRQTEETLQEMPSFITIKSLMAASDSDDDL